MEVVVKALAKVAFRPARHRGTALLVAAYELRGVYAGEKRRLAGGRLRQAGDAQRGVEGHERRPLAVHALAPALHVYGTN
jgi:hypothetical protein